MCNHLDLHLCWQYADKKPRSNPVEFFNLVYIIMEEENLDIPANAEQALLLYFNLINIIENI